MSSPYCCPECGDGLLFRPDPCPTCASRQRQKQQAAPAGEKRSSYDLTGRVAAAEFWQLLRWYPCCPCCGKPWSKVGLFWRGRGRAFDGGRGSRLLRRQDAGIEPRFDQRAPHLFGVGPLPVGAHLNHRAPQEGIGGKLLQLG